MRIVNLSARIVRICAIIISSAGKNPFDPRGAFDLEWGSGLYRTGRALAPRRRRARNQVNVVHVSSFKGKRLIF